MADDKALQKLIKEPIKEGSKKVRRLDGNLHAGLNGVLRSYDYMTFNSDCLNFEAFVFKRPSQGPSIATSIA